MSEGSKIDGEGGGDEVRTTAADQDADELDPYEENNNLLRAAWEKVCKERDDAQAALNVATYNNHSLERKVEDLRRTLEVKQKLGEALDLENERLRAERDKAVSERYELQGALDIIKQLMKAGY